METKKTIQASLENKRGLFFQTGLILSLSASLIAFEWNTRENTGNNSMLSLGDNFTEETIDNTFRVEKKQPQPPPQRTQTFAILKNDVNLQSTEVNVQSETSESDTFSSANWVNPPDEKPEAETILWKAEKMPEFRGGDIQKFWEYIMKHVKYPEEAREMGLEGRVSVQFVVNESGKIDDIKILRGVDPLLDNEVIAALENSPDWKPGKQGNKNVKVAFALPVTFQLTK